MTAQTTANLQLQIQVQVQVQTEQEELSPLTAQQLKTLEQLLTAQKSRLTHFIRKNLRQEELVEDVLQRTHLAAFQGWGRFRGESKPETWLFGIAMNLIRNVRTRTMNAPWMAEDAEEELLNLPADETAEPSAILQRQEIVEALKQAIHELPIRMQAAVQLVFLEGLSYQEAAEELDLPVGTIRSRLSRARDMLRECVAIAA